ncbi:MAG: hypothetical protein K2W82_11140 [Candidatus Obscuribacterales bacterium]|nr:hypothetical protein [Candidatus Obscuribacterales bacterium]
MLAATLSVSFDPLHLIGLIVLGYVASFIGNILGLIGMSLVTPSLDGQRFFKILIFVNAAVAMTIPKLIVASIAAIVTMSVCATTGSALVWTMVVCGLVGFAFTFIASTNTRI